MVDDYIASWKRTKGKTLLKALVEERLVVAPALDYMMAQCWFLVGWAGQGPNEEVQVGKWRGE